MYALDNNVSNEAVFSNLATQLADLRVQKNALEKKEKEIVAELYALGVFDKDSKQPQTFEDDSIIVNKIPTLKHYDVEKVRVLAKALKISPKDLIKREWKFSVNNDALVALVATGRFPSTLLDELAIKYNKLTAKRKN